MLRILPLLCLLFLLVGLPTAAAQGYSVDCDNGSSFTNGVEVRVVQMRAGFTYTATAIGIDGFDPVLAVLNESGTGFCSDNAREAADYSADLPTAGSVSSSTSSAQVRFDQNNGQALADMSLVVGSVDSIPGEFVLILEGMAATSADGDGDPFAVQLTPDMVASGVPLTVYMISVTDDLDPMTILTYSDGETFYDDDNNPIYCDDAGDNSRCWGESTNLSQSFVTRENGRQLGGFGRDAMLSIPLDGFTLDSDPSQNYVNYLMTSYEQSTFGDYVLAFHAGIGEGGSSGTKGNAGPGKGQQSDDDPTPVPPDTSDVPMGISVTCDNGASFDNGVEIRVDLMRSGFTYTATAIGSDGFDPVLAVLNEDGVGTCSDNANSASDYTFDLPTTGRGEPSNQSAQLDFTQNSGQGMADVSLVVGSLGNTSGEFVLVLEGMAATAADGPGDAFSVRMTPGMVASGVPLSVYMISLTNDLDPLMAYVDEDLEVLYDTDNVPIICDDSGDTSRCWGESFSLNDSYVMLADGRRLGGFGRDAMLSLPLGNFTLSEDTNFNYLNFLMTTYEQSSFGEYILAFHVGLEHSGGGNADV